MSVASQEAAVPAGYATLLGASFFFSWAIVPSRGAYTDFALAFVLLACVLVTWRFAAMCLAPGAAGEPVSARQVSVPVWAGALGMAFFASNDIESIIYPVKGWEAGRAAQAVTIIAVLSYLPFLGGRREPSPLKWVRLAALAGALAVGGAATYDSSPRPHIDVWTVQQAGAQALAEGSNPYTSVAMRDTGPRTAQDVPYVYPPTQVLLTMPAWWLAREVRFTMLAALLLLGACLRFITGRAGRALPSVVLDGPTLFVWCSPKLYFILEQAWIDPVQMGLVSLLFALAVFRRGSWVTAVALGLVLSAKQTMFWLVGQVAWILRLPFRRWALAGVTAGAIVLPFVLWNFAALKHANFDFVNALPHRPDALTFNNWGFRKFGHLVPGSFGFGLALIVSAFAAWKLRGSAARASVAAATTYTWFFVFNKWCFANYFFTLLSLAAIAAACSFHSEEPAQE